AGFPGVADDLGGGAIAAGVFTVPVPEATCWFWFVAVPAGFLVASGAMAVPAGFLAASGTAGVGGAAPRVLGEFGSCLGMLGKRWERISAARIGAEPGAADGLLSPVSMTTSTSSKRRRSAEGLILILRNGSLSRSGTALLTVPTDKPLGKMRS